MAYREREIINLISSDDEDSDSGVEEVPPPRPREQPAALAQNALNPPFPREPLAAHAHPADVPQQPEDQADGGVHIPRPDYEDIDFFINPEMNDMFPELPGPAGHMDDVYGAMPLEPALGPPVVAHAAAQNAETGADRCLQHVLTVFPDISHDHVRKLYTDFDEAEGEYEALAEDARLQNIIDHILNEPSYPQQPAPTNNKRKNSNASLDDRAAKRWDNNDRMELPNYLRNHALTLLKADFQTATHVEIQQQFTKHKHFYPTYLALAADQDSETPQMSWRGRPTTGNSKKNADAPFPGSADLTEELEAARKAVLKIRTERRIEAENLRTAMSEGAMATCNVCYDDFPLSRQAHCDGPEPHFTCFTCMLSHVQSMIGSSRCRPTCLMKCGGSYSHGQLFPLRSRDAQLMEKFDELRQEGELRDAGIEDLEECPFCPFKAVYEVAIETDCIFRCQNPDCQKPSCRRCKKVSHIPLTCEQHAKDGKLDARHGVEEAMTRALIRNCNGCKKPFFKEDGCNKIRCTACEHMQCYVCSKSVTDYNHFDQGAGMGGPRGANLAADPSAPKKCPLYDDVNARHAREVAAAEETARAALIAANPDITAADLEIKVAEGVGKAPARRGVMGHMEFAQRYGAFLGGAGLDDWDLPAGGMPLPMPPRQRPAARLRPVGVGQQQRPAGELGRYEDPMPAAGAYVPPPYLDDRILGLAQLRAGQRMGGPAAQPDGQPHADLYADTYDRLGRREALDREAIQLAFGQRQPNMQQAQERLQQQRARHMHAAPVARGAPASLLGPAITAAQARLREQLAQGENLPRLGAARNPPLAAPRNFAALRAGRAAEAMGAGPDLGRRPEMRYMYRGDVGGDYPDAEDADAEGGGEDEDKDDEEAEERHLMNAILHHDPDRARRRAQGAPMPVFGTGGRGLW